jgi:Tol biopolymer transport system component
LIAVYDFGGSAIRFLAPTVDKDSLPRWSPDGRSLAFVRTAGDQAKLPLIPIRPKPWSIWVADASTGSASVVWQSGEKLDDSLPGLTEDESFKFAAGDRIVFSSEQDGRNHLYAIATSGGTATLLTPGDFDVEQVTLSSDKNSLLYTSNEGDVDRRHLWRVAVAGGTPPNALTSGGRSNGLRSKRVTAKAWFASDRLPGHPRCHT